MPVPKLYPDSVAAKFRPGTLESIKPALVGDETRAEFIRRMVEVGVAIGDLEGFDEAVHQNECRAAFVRRMVEEGLARRREAKAAAAAGGDRPAEENATSHPGHKNAVVCSLCMAVITPGGASF